MFAAAMALRSAALNHRQALEAFFYTLLGLIALSAFDYRRDNPFSWLDYHTSPLFGDYVAVQDPAHGPHLLPQEVHDLVSPVCREVGSGKDMLSLPYSFANYYCGIPLWHNVVQTFFDTSTAPQIERIMEGLNHDPPAYIFYQRQIPEVRQHEIIFNRGRPLVHRQLDQLIVTKVRSGDWKIVYRSDAFAPSHWYLIETGKRR